MTMEKTLHRLSPGPRAGFLAVAFLVFSAASLHLLRAAEKPAASAPQTALARELEGMWVHVGEPGKVGQAPAKGGFIKLRTARHWAAIAIDPRSGLVTSTHGGTWRIKGNEYEETVDYGGDYHAEIMNKTWKWTLTLEGDTLTKKGINNDWHEVWKRVK